LVCAGAELRAGPHRAGSPEPRRIPFDAVLVVCEGGAVREQALRGVGLWVSKLDALPNGRFLLQGHGGDRTTNVQVYGSDGRSRRAFAMGRAIEFVMADRQHHVWSAYGDEGVYSDPVSSAGLVRWDSGGNQLWRYREPKGVEYIDTVYAFNVDDGVAWAVYYPTFPLLEARTDGRIRVRATPVAGPRGLAVYGDEVVMLGDRQRADRLHRCRLAEREATVAEEATLALPNGAPLTTYARPVGRGPRLYLRGKSVRQWYVLDLQRERLWA
jgi:hypothetical protein